MTVDLVLPANGGTWGSHELDRMIGRRVPFPDVDDERRAMIVAVTIAPDGSAATLTLDPAAPVGEVRPVDALHAPVGTFHPETSHTAAAKVIGGSGTDRRLVYDFVTSRGAHGATDDEIEQALHMKHQTASARRNGLVSDGWLISSGEKRDTRSNTPATVWIAAPEQEHR